MDIQVHPWQIKTWNLRKKNRPLEEETSSSKASFSCSMLILWGGCNWWFGALWFGNQSAPKNPNPFHKGIPHKKKIVGGYDSLLPNHPSLPRHCLCRSHGGITGDATQTSQSSPVLERKPVDGNQKSGKLISFMAGQPTSPPSLLPPPKKNKGLVAGLVKGKQ